MKRNAAVWGRLVAEQASSGLGVSEFCRRNEVSPASFYQWRRKLREAASSPQAFVPVSLVEGGGVSVEWPCGAVLRLPAGDERSLSQIVLLLMAAGEQAE